MYKALISTNNKDKIQQLELENKQLQIENSELRQFKMLMAKVAHDINSPLSAVFMILPQCTILPEKLSNNLKYAITRINDIAQDILNQFVLKPNLAQKQSIINSQPILIALEILSLVESKKIEYANYPINFVTAIGDTAYFTYLAIDKVSFNRAMSNLINNAVDSLGGKAGTITVNVNATNKRVNISIADTGKGMPQIIVYKLMHGISVTANKANGHGIGFEQVREMLKGNNGKMSIDSTVGKGTVVKLSFPRTEYPLHLCEKLELHSSDLVIILDNELYIHEILEPKFKKAVPDIKLKCFSKQQDLEEFINSLTSKEKNQITLLANQEVLQQVTPEFNVIRDLKHCILVTEQDNDSEFMSLIEKTNIKILPEALVSELPIVGYANLTTCPVIQIC